MSLDIHELSWSKWRHKDTGAEYLVREIRGTVREVYQPLPHRPGEQSPNQEHRPRPDLIPELSGSRDAFSIEALPPDEVILSD